MTSPKRSYKIHVDLQKEVLVSILGAVYMLVSKKLESFISILGLLLFIWYLFWDAVLVDLVVHPLHNQPELYFLYVIIDIASFSYFFYEVHYSETFKGKILWAAKFLIVWNLAFAFIDMFVPVNYAPNNTSALFNVAMFFLSTLTAAVIAYGEVGKVLRDNPPGC